MSSILGYTLIGDSPGETTSSPNGNTLDSPSPRCIGCLAASRGHTMVCAEHYYPTRSPHANGQERNPPLQLTLQPPPQCTPKRPHPTPPRAT
jgi:hypothetical protein